MGCAWVSTYLSSEDGINGGIGIGFHDLTTVLSFPKCPAPSLIFSLPIPIFIPILIPHSPFPIPCLFPPSTSQKSRPSPTQPCVHDGWRSTKPSVETWLGCHEQILLICILQNAVLMHLALLPLDPD